MAFGGPRSSCARPGAHSARHQSAGAHAPHSDERLGPTATQGSSHSARRLRSLAFLCSSMELKTIERPYTYGHLEFFKGAPTGG